MFSLKAPIEHREPLLQMTNACGNPNAAEPIRFQNSAGLASTRYRPTKPNILIYSQFDKNTLTNIDWKVIYNLFFPLIFSLLKTKIQTQFFLISMNNLKIKNFSMLKWWNDLVMLTAATIMAGTKVNKNKMAPELDHVISIFKGCSYTLEYCETNFNMLYKIKMFFLPELNINISNSLIIFRLIKFLF